jgi:hypothetical protein
MSIKGRQSPVGTRQSEMTVDAEWPLPPKIERPQSQTQPQSNRLPTAHSRLPKFCFTRSSPAWWLLRSDKTRSHPELGRQTLQRQWYYVSRPGRVGRCQACQERINLITNTNQKRPTWAALAFKAQSPNQPPKKLDKAKPKAQNATQ